MYNSFDEFYSEAYNMFYNTCKARENIDVEQINNTKLKIDIELRRISIKNIPIPDIEGMEDVKRIIEGL